MVAEAVGCVISLKLPPIGLELLCKEKCVVVGDLKHLAECPGFQMMKEQRMLKFSWVCPRLCSGESSEITRPDALHR